MLNDIDFTRISALAVEVEESGMATIGLMMRYMGMRAFINTTGEGVLEMAHAMKPGPDIVFMDLHLPRVSGYTLLAEIRADPRLKAVLVVAVTAQDADTEIPKCKAAGFDGFIGKPISRSRFPKQVRRILSGEKVWETY